MEQHRQQELISGRVATYCQSHPTEGAAGETEEHEIHVLLDVIEELHQENVELHKAVGDGSNLELHFQGDDHASLLRTLDDLQKQNMSLRGMIEERKQQPSGQPDLGESPEDEPEVGAEPTGTI